MSGVSVRGLTVARGGRLVVEDCSFSAQAGSVTAILGASGAGKTTLLAACAGLLPAERGAVLLDEVAQGRSRPGIAFLPPGFALPEGRTVRDALARLSGRAGRSAMAATLDALGMDRLGDRSVASLSHGEGLFALAAARLAAPSAGQQALLVDEAGSGLEAASSMMLLHLLRARARQGAAILMATRDPAVAFAADHLVLLQEGRVLQAGLPALVHAEPCCADAALLTGPATILGGTVREVRPGGLLWTGGGRFIQATGPETPRPPLGAAIRLCLRAERVVLLPAPGSVENQVQALVEEVTFSGALLSVRLATPAGALMALWPAWQVPVHPVAGMTVIAGWRADAGVILP